MDWKDVAKKALEIIPGLGVALGPLTGGSSAAIGVAVGAMTKAFGLSADSGPEAVMEAITTDPEARLKLLMADNDFKLKQRDQDIEELKAILADMKSARDRDISLRQSGQTNRRADIMLICAFVAIIVIAIILGTKNVDAASAIGGFLLTIGGMFARNIGTAFDFEFGSSRSSMEKTKLLAEAPAILGDK